MITLEPPPPPPQAGENLQEDWYRIGPREAAEGPAGAGHSREGGPTSDKKPKKSRGEEEMFYDEPFLQQVRGYPIISRDEAQLFVSDVLHEDLPETYPPSLDWMKQLIMAFHTRLPFQNITFLSKTENCCVPSWEEIQRDVLKEGKGGLCLSLNAAFAAVARALGVLAYLVPGDYVATKGRSVHALTVFHSCVADQILCKNNEVKSATQTKKFLRRSPRLKQKKIHRCGASHSHPLDSMCITSFYRKSMFLADVGCGFPTRRAINLSDDLGKTFVDCGLEYCFIKKGRTYLRLHRRGDDVPDGEQKFVNQEGWRPVFSFALTPQPLSYFSKVMRSVYANKEVSPYFTELHAVRYLSNSETAAIKATWSSQKGCNNCKNYCSECNMEMSVKTNRGERREIERNLTNTDIITHITINFPMIPKSEVKKSVDYFCALGGHI